jgi:hypothetical protein
MPTMLALTKHRVIAVTLLHASESMATGASLSESMATGASLSESMSTGASLSKCVSQATRKVQDTKGTAIEEFRGSGG